MTLPVIAVIIVAAQRLGELLLAGRNYRWAMRHGAREVGAGHYWLFIVLHGGWLVSLFLECLVREPTAPSWWPLPAVMLALAQILRYWAIRALGKRWNTRIVVFPGRAVVRSGPYRYLKHPNYIAVAIELFSLPALLGAWCTALLFTVLNGALLLLVRIPVEERALRSRY